MTGNGSNKGATVDLDRQEVALILGDEGEGMSVRLVPGADLPDEVVEAPPAHEIAIALATRLLRDPDFHEEMLDWYYNQPEDEEEGKQPE